MAKRDIMIDEDVKNRYHISMILVKIAQRNMDTFLRL